LKILYLPVRHVTSHSVGLKTKVEYILKQNVEGDIRERTAGS